MMAGMEAEIAIVTGREMAGRDTMTVTIGIATTAEAGITMETIGIETVTVTLAIDTEMVVNGWLTKETGRRGRVLTAEIATTMNGVDITGGTMITPVENLLEIVIRLCEAHRRLLLRKNGRD